MNHSTARREDDCAAEASFISVGSLGHPGLFITHNDPRESTDKHVIKAPLTRPSREDLSTSIRLITFRELMPAYQQQSKETFHVKELSTSDKRIQPTELKHRFQIKAITMLTISVLLVGT
ncbi:unnamed protein product [Leuciscus chuanchicus]